MVDDAEARAAAREILSRTEFTRWHEDVEAWLALVERLIEAMPQWLVDALEWLEAALSTVLGWLERVLSLLGLFGDVSEWIGWGAVCLLAAGGIVLAWRVGALRRSSRREGSTRPTPGRSHAEALREARALAGRGRFVEAAHGVQLATLALLIDFGWLELARSDPNRTLRRRVVDSRLPERERRQLVQLVDRLEALWFDERREDRQLFEDWLSLDARIVSLAAGGGA